MNRSNFAIGFVSCYLLCFLVLIHTPYTRLIWSMFLFSPVLVAWMVYTVIKYGKYSGKELDEGEEWGYEDKSRDELGFF